MKKLALIATTLLLISCSEQDSNKIKNSVFTTEANKKEESKFSCTNPETLKTLTQLIEENIIKGSRNKEFELGVKVETVSTLSNEPLKRCEASISYTLPADLKNTDGEKLLVTYNLKKNEIKEGEVYLTIEPVDISKLITMQSSVLNLRGEIATNNERNICANLIGEIKSLNIREMRDSLGTALNMLRSKQFNEYQSAKFNPRFDSDVWYEKNGNPPFTHRKDYYQNNSLKVEIYSMYSDGTSRRGDFTYPVGYNVETVKYFAKEQPIRITKGLIGYSCDVKGKVYSFSD